MLDNEASGVTRARRGSSGASLKVARSYAIKSGDLRVADQGEWIQKHQSPVLPNVTAVRRREDLGLGQYAMDRLTDAPLRLFYAPRLVMEMIDGLQKHVWDLPAEVTFSYDALFNKLAGLVPVTSYDDLKRKADGIDWDTLPSCMTHGDPTFDNVMLNSEGDVVIIDPLPANPAVPNLRCVDLAKIFQSILGFEQVRYEGFPDMNGFRGYQMRTLREVMLDTNEWRATMFWVAIHYFRAVPYMPEGKVRYEIKRTAINLASSL